MVIVNQDQKLYVISSGNGHTCFGFDNCFYDSLQLSQRLNLPSLAPKESEVGTKAQYEQYRKLLEIARNSPSSLDTWFTPGTPYEVRAILERARNNNHFIRIFYGDKVTGKDWLEENDCYGKIGRSTGTMKVPLLIEKGKFYGSAILTNSIVQIIKFTRSKGGDISEILYSHEKYHRPKFEIVNCFDEKYSTAVKCDGEIHAQFTSESKAQKWIDFMTGKVAKP